MFCSKCGQSVSDDAAFCTNCGAAVTPSAGATPGASMPPFASPEWRNPVSAAPAWDYAPWGDRVIGYIVDWLVVFGAIVVLGVLAALGIGGMFGLHTDEWNPIHQGACCASFALLGIAAFFVGIYNRFYLIYTRGYSIGQGVMHLKVVDAQGALLQPGPAFLRLIMHTVFGFVPGLQMIDLLWPLWDERKQTLHDKVAGSYVIRNLGA